MTRSSDIIVIGAGIHGLSCAFHLACEKRAVTILEKDVVGQHASSVNAGGLRTLLRDIPEIPLSLESQKRWENLDQILGSKLAKPAKVTTNVGQIGIAVEASEMEWCKSRANETKRLGYDYEEIIDRKELDKLIDNLSSECLGGIIARKDGHASPANATQAYRSAASAAGVRIHERVVIDRITRKDQQWIVHTDDGAFEAPVVVNCSGAWGHKVAESVGDRLPIECQALSMMVTKRVGFNITPVVIGIDQPLSFKQTDIGTLVIGGGIPAKPEPDLSTSKPYAERLIESAKTLTRFFPSFSDVQIVRTWSGLEGFTPDRMPIIGPSTDAENFWHVCGFSAHGFQLAPETGFRVARSIVNNQVDNLIAPFTPSRFQIIKKVS
ncbi:NAD(P)/FAD-dependent oxidoreductase [Hoeflea prorocentri]|uniref:FAD-binding oxidoreductase n=1 Tax=Hoeflea prorocentri TaxID=1922333 RepID=A0A9X3UDE8_9HYPH|nr:FAD-binding oxidoreductase [Hoeflea prorocentri]MCY6379367.1 FAD-binding oxidoreductase [Hoeflea prorocentri]MDA5397168.1 FAD-binding oxidoreductase [Hoeflea prorocentri]